MWSPLAHRSAGSPHSTGVFRQRLSAIESFRSLDWERGVGRQWRPCRLDGLLPLAPHRDEENQDRRTDRAAADITTLVICASFLPVGRSQQTGMKSDGRLVRQGRLWAPPAAVREFPRGCHRANESSCVSASVCTCGFEIEPR